VEVSLCLMLSSLLGNCCGESRTAHFCARPDTRTCPQASVCTRLMSSTNVRSDTFSGYLCPLFISLVCSSTLATHQTINVWLQRIESIMVGTFCWQKIPLTKPKVLSTRPRYILLEVFFFFFRCWNTLQGLFWKEMKLYRVRRAFLLVLAMISIFSCKVLSYKICSYIKKKLIFQSQITRWSLKIWSLYHIRGLKERR